MKFLLPLLTAAVITTPTPVKADVSRATFSGLLIGEIVCSMARANVNLRVIEREVKRVTENLYLADILDVKDEKMFQYSIKKVVEVCPTDNGDAKTFR